MIARPQADLLNLLPLAPAAQSAPAVQTLGAQAPRFDAVLLQAVKESKTFTFAGDFEALNPKVSQALEAALGRLSQLPLDQLRQAVTQGLPPAVQAEVEQAGKDLRLDGPQTSQLNTLVQAVLPRLAEQLASRSVVQEAQTQGARPGHISGPQGGDPVAPLASTAQAQTLESAASEGVPLPPAPQKERVRQNGAAAEPVALVAAMQGPVLISTRTSDGAQEDGAPAPVAATPTTQPQGRSVVVAVRETAPAAVTAPDAARTLAPEAPRSEATFRVQAGGAVQPPSSILERTVTPTSAIRTPQAAPTAPEGGAAETAPAEHGAGATAAQPKPRVLSVATAQAAPATAPEAPAVPAAGAPLPAVTTTGSSAPTQPHPEQGQMAAPSAPRTTAPAPAPARSEARPAQEPETALAPRPSASNPVVRDLEVSVAPLTSPVAVDEDSVVTLKGGSAPAPAPAAQTPARPSSSPVQAAPSAQQARATVQPEAAQTAAPAPAPAQAQAAPGPSVQSAPAPKPAADVVVVPPSVQAGSPAPAPVQAAPPAAAQPVQASLPQGTAQAEQAGPVVRPQASAPDASAATVRPADDAENKPAVRVAWHQLQSDGSNLEGRRFSDAEVRQLAQQAVRDLGLRESVLQQVTEAVAGASRETSRLVIKLKPESLGAVEVELKIEAGRLVARLVTNQAEVRDVIASNLPAFKQNLQDQGLSVRELSVAVKAETRQQQGQPQQQQSQPSWLADIKKQFSQAANPVVLPQVFIPSGPASRFSAVA